MYDYIIIGAGSGGVRLSRLLGAAGRKVAVVEGSGVGGTCVLKGCIPKKLFIYATSFANEDALARDYGWSVATPQFEVAKFMAAKEDELARLSGIYENILERNNVELLRGYARFISNSKVEVAGREYQAHNFIIATGSKSASLNFPGCEHCLNSDAFLNITHMPKEALVIGGGYIGTEFTRILLGGGTKVHMLIRSGIPLRGFDTDVSSFIKEQMEAQGVNFIEPQTIKMIKPHQGRYQVTLSGTDTPLVVDKVINVIGRTPNTQGLSLAAAGVELGAQQEIIVDDNFQTSAPNIYAIGDVINKLNLTPVATRQAMHLAEHFLSDKKVKIKPIDYRYVAKAVFCYPEVAACGLTQAEAEAEGYQVDIYKSTFTPLKNTLTTKKARSFFKLVVDRSTQKVLGIHIVDTHAAEAMQGFAVSLSLGVTKAQLDAVIGIHPTSAEELVTMYNKAST